MIFFANIQSGAWSCDDCSRKSNRHQIH